MSHFFDYEGITFNRNAIQAVSGSTINESNPGHLPYFRIVLRDNQEWHITAETEENLQQKRTAFLAALTA